MGFGFKYFRICLAMIPLFLGSIQECLPAGSLTTLAKVNIPAERVKVSAAHALATHKNSVSVPTSGQIYHSVFPGDGSIDAEENDVTPETLHSYEQAVGKTAAWVYFSHNWFQGHEFPLANCNWIRNDGSLPFIRLMMRSSGEQDISEPVYSLDNIISGTFDADLRTWAQAVSAFGSPILVEFGTEVNGAWFSWNGIWNGAGTLDEYGDPTVADGPERFRDAYRHIIQITRDEGVSNITWVFHVYSEDIPEVSWNQLELYYPGNTWIDWIGVSIYGAETPMDTECDSFRTYMDAIYPRLAALSPDKPITVLEIGTTRGNSVCRQDMWTRSALTDLIAGRWKRVIGFSWWNENWANDENPSHDTVMRVEDNLALSGVFQDLVASNPDVLGRYIFDDVIFSDGFEAITTYLDPSLVESVEKAK